MARRSPWSQRPAGPAIMFPLVLIAAVVSSCSPVHRVDSYIDWCAELSGDDLYTKYRTLGLTYDHTALRLDFVRTLNETTGATRVKGRSTIVVEGPEAFGFWIEGDDLHFINTLVSALEALSLEREFLAIARDGYMDREGAEADRCMSSMLHSHFASVVVHGPAGRITTLPLDFRLRPQLHSRTPTRKPS